MIARILSCLLFVTCFALIKVESQSQKPEYSSPDILTAPENYQLLIPRLSSQPSCLYQNLLYEGNNMVMRELKGSTSREWTGSSIAEHWQNIVVHTQGTFVLRDALFSQQDHPYLFLPFALMLPPNWITAAASQSGDLQPLIAPEVHNDSAWLAISSPEKMFGSFPPSEVLFKIATGRDTSVTDLRLIYNARQTIVILANYTKRLIDRRKSGVDAMIKEGAEIIAQGDTLYFGGNIRKHHIIPIIVENPTLHELEEGKGVAILGRDNIPIETVALVRQAIYQRRLNDGDIALERYDISNPAERKRAISVLQELIPRGSSGASVWLWVTGRMRPDRAFEGEDASKYIDQFRIEIKTANIEESRLNMVSKPSIQLSKGKEMKRSLDDAVARFHQLHLPLSINITSEKLKQLIGKE
jgi:hypothetical protein